MYGLTTEDSSSSSVTTQAKVSKSKQHVENDIKGKVYDKTNFDFKKNIRLMNWNPWILVIRYESVVRRNRRHLIHKKNDEEPLKEESTLLLNFPEEMEMTQRHLKVILTCLWNVIHDLQKSLNLRMLWSQLPLRQEAVGKSKNGIVSTSEVFSDSVGGNVVWCDHNDEPASGFDQRDLYLGSGNVLKD